MDYVVKCDRCKRTIRETKDMRESCAGGRCEACREYERRHAAKVERFQGYADNAQKRANAASRSARAATEGIPFGQPILVGHHSERGHRAALRKQNRRYERARDEQDRADHWNHRAAIVEKDHNIHREDPAARVKLEAKIAALEAERDRIKAYNASCRHSARDLSLLDDQQRENIESVARHQPSQMGKGGGFPGYALSNLNGNLRRYKERLDALIRPEGCSTPPMRA